MRYCSWLTTIILHDLLRNCAKRLDAGFCRCDHMRQNEPIIAMNKRLSQAEAHSASEVFSSKRQ